MNLENILAQALEAVASASEIAHFLLYARILLIICYVFIHRKRSLAHRLNELHPAESCCSIRV